MAMRLNEKIYTRNINGLALCDGKRIDDKFAVIRPWFVKERIYYVIHIASGLQISKGCYKTIKEAIDKFPDDLSRVYSACEEKGTTFDERVKPFVEEFNRMYEAKEFFVEGGERKWACVTITMKLPSEV